jgi:hypothetical protein
MVSPFGRRTVKGVRDLTLFRHGALTKRNWTVHQESTIAVSCCLRRDGVRQTSNVELLFKVAARNIILCCPDCLQCYRLEWSLFCGQVSGVAREARVSATNIVVMSPTLIACGGVDTSWAPPVTSFIIEQSLEFSQLGGVVIQLFYETRLCLSERGHHTSARCSCGCCRQI